MPQRTLCVPLEVKPESCSRLSALIAEFRERKYPAGRGFADTYERIKIDVPPLHFMSMSVFPSATYDPIFILEANFDGEAVPSGDRSRAFGEELRAMLRCCKKPLDEDGPLYESVTAPGSRAPVAPYFDARTQRPSVFITAIAAWRGTGFSTTSGSSSRPRGDRLPQRPEPLSRDGQRRGACGVADAAAAGLPVARQQGADSKISIGERARDLGRLIAFAVVLLLVLSLPGLVLAPILPWRSYFIVMAARRC